MGGEVLDLRHDDGSRGVTRGAVAVTVGRWRWRDQWQVTRSSGTAISSGFNGYAGLGEGHVADRMKVGMCEGDEDAC